MITLDLQHLFNTDPHSTKVPKKVFDWVIAKEKEFPVQYQIMFTEYKSEDEKRALLPFEKTYFSENSFSQYTPGEVKCIQFPLSDGKWLIRIIGAELSDGTLIPFTDQDNPNHKTSKRLGKKRGVISGLQDCFDREDPLLVLLNSSNEGHEKVWDTTWGYKKSETHDPQNNEMVEIRCDRNINDEWKFRGTIEEFKDQIIKPLMN